MTQYVAFPALNENETTCQVRSAEALAKLNKKLDTNECGTNCCIVGFASIKFIDELMAAFPMPNAHSSFYRYGEYLFGINYGGRIWDYLFDSHCPNNRNEMARRVAYVLYNIENEDTSCADPTQKLYGIAKSKRILNYWANTEITQ